MKYKDVDSIFKENNLPFTRERKYDNYVNSSTYITMRDGIKIAADIYLPERNEFLKLANRIMTKDLQENWKWINVQLSIEAELAPPGMSWHHKKEVEIPE